MFLNIYKQPKIVKLCWVFHFFEWRLAVFLNNRLNFICIYILHFDEAYLDFTSVTVNVEQSYFCIYLNMIAN